MEPGAAHCLEDEAFLDVLFDRIVAQLEEGGAPSAAELAGARDHLLPRIEALIALARQVRPDPGETLPHIPGYTVLREAGRGGMGAVYLARQERLGGRPVALKLLPPSVAISARARERFREEAHAIARLSHPNIVAVHDVVTADGLHAFAMEWVDGQSLAEWIAERSSAPVDTANHEVEKLRRREGEAGGGAVFVCRVGIAVARALQAVHAAGLLHRDVKPSNILLRRDGTPLLSDFGLAREADAALTEPGRFAGTAAYAPPEQLRGDAQRLDPRSDVYALGATLYHALALRPPFEGHDPHRLLSQIEGAGPRPLRRLNPRLPRDLATVVEKAIEADPARRYQTADELADDLERVRTLRPIRARPAGPLTRVLKLVRRRRGLLAAAVGGAALASGLLVLLGVYLLAVPGWAAAHVRAARLALVSPALGVNIASVQVWGRVNDPPPEVVERWRRTLAGALEHYDAALRLAPFDDVIRRERAVVDAVVRGRELDAPDARSAGLYAFLSHDYERALADWEAYEAQRDPGAEPDALVSAALGIMHLFGDAPARAYPRLRDACRELPDVGFLTTYHAEAALRCGDLALAQRLLDAAAGMPMLDPGGARERVRAGLLAAQGHDEQAEALYRELPWNAVALLEFGEFLRSRGRVEEALQHYRSAFRAAPVMGAGRRFIAAADEWWASQTGEQRLARIRGALDEPTWAEGSLVRLLADYQAALSAVASRPADASRPPRSSFMNRQLAALHGVFSSPSLESLSLSSLAQRMEVEDMQWSRFDEAPAALKCLVAWSWRLPVLRPVARMAISSLRPLRGPAKRLTFATGIMAIASVAHAQMPHFQGFGGTPSHPYSSPSNLSGDGTTVVGVISDTNQFVSRRIFRWHVSDGMADLGQFGGTNGSTATGVSYDGSKISLSAWNTPLSNCFDKQAAGIWTAGTGMQQLAGLPGGCNYANAWGMSDDGVKIVGASFGTGGYLPTIWINEVAATISSVFVNPSVARRISRDGHWIGGGEGAFPGAFRWSAELGVERFSDPANAVQFEITGIANNGAVVGYTLNSQPRAFYWTPATGLQYLAKLDMSTTATVAYAILADGSLILGRDQSASGASRAVVWDLTFGVQDLRVFLASRNVHVPDCWTLTSSVDAVFDGSMVTMCGSALNAHGNNEAWIARFHPEPGPGSASWRPVSADAGHDVTVAEGVLVELDGSGSYSICVLPVYHWTQIAGPAVTLTGADTATPSFTAPLVPMGGAVLTFQLVVSDGTNASQPDIVNVHVTNVNNAPVAVADDLCDGLAVAEAGLATLDGSNSYDADDEPLTYSWVQTGGTAVVLSDADAAVATFATPLVGPAGEILTFELTVSDGEDASTVSINVCIENVNHLPIASAGADQTVAEGASVTLDAAGSSDPDGDTLTYEWTQVSGPAVVLSDHDTATPSFTAPQVGPAGATLVFRVTVDDGYGGDDSAEVTITVQDSTSAPECDLAKPSVAELWPPNRKLVPITITAVTHGSNPSVSITILGVTQDEPTTGLGDGDTGPDAVIQGGTVLLRAERAGGGNGRVYRVTFLADDGLGGTCTGSVTVTVPHDKGKNKPPAVDDGQSYSSSGP